MSRKADLVVGNTYKGKGVFARKSFRKGEDIINFKGKLFTFETLPTPYDKFDDHYVQIGDNLYMGPSGDIDDYFNHSCNPNSGLAINGTKARLIAIRDISADQEITWDYSTTMDEDEWNLTCACESPNCRKQIFDFKYLPKNIQNTYINANIVPQYILDNMKASSTVKKRVRQ